jgi:hypothetical protein
MSGEGPGGVMRASLVAVALVVGLAACAAPAPSPTSAPTPTAATSVPPAPSATEFVAIDACALLTGADAESLLDESVPEPGHFPLPPWSTCSYFVSTNHFAQLQICHCFPGDQFDENVRAGAESIEVVAEPVSELGDKAYWLDGVLWVQRGDVVFNVWVLIPSYFEDDGRMLHGDKLTEAALATTRGAAERIISRLD